MKGEMTYYMYNFGKRKNKCKIYFVVNRRIVL